MKVMSKIINENFPSEYLYVYEGGIDETTELLKLKFDKIFSQEVQKWEKLFTKLPQKI